jgi:hypothetical protein
VVFLLLKPTAQPSKQNSANKKHQYRDFDRCKELIKMLEWYQVSFCLLSSFLAIIVLFKNYRIVTIFEYTALACSALILPEMRLTLTSFHTIKVATSLLFFLVDIVSNNLLGVSVLTYMMSSVQNPCHAVLGVGEVVYHYAFPQTRPATSDERSYYLAPQKHSKSTLELRHKMFFAPCVGFVIPSSRIHLEESLQSCGKCQDWATIALYTLSCHKYLSYSCVFFFRWGSWIFFILGVLFNCLPYANKLVMRKVMPQATDPMLDTLVDKYQIVACFVSNVIHAFMIAFDVSNLRTEKLEDNDNYAAKLFPRRNYCYESMKLLTMFILSCIWIVYFPKFVIQIDFILYFVMCMIASIVTHVCIQTHRPTLGNSNADNVLPKKAD